MRWPLALLATAAHSVKIYDATNYTTETWLLIANIPDPVQSVSLLHAGFAGLVSLARQGILSSQIQSTEMPDTSTFYVRGLGFNTSNHDPRQVQ